MEETLKIGFIGCGRVGSSLAKYFQEKNLNIVGVFDRTEQNGQEVANFVGTTFYKEKKELVDKCNIIFVTVSDSSIKTVWDEISQSENSYLQDKVFIHCSGAASSAIFETSNPEVTLCSLHPAQAFCDRYKSYLDLPKTVFTLEYNNLRNNKNIDLVKILLGKIGNKFAQIDCQSKVKYHASCVMASNLVVALASVALDTLGECDIPQDVAQDLLGSLLVGNSHNILDNGPVKALTGPIDRNDTITVQAHLSQLSEASKEIYIKLSQKLVEIAKIKNPEKNYNEIEKVLSKNQ